MSQSLIKYSKYFLIGLLPLLFISSIGSDQGSSLDLRQGKFLSLFSEFGTQELKGDMSFESTSQSFRDGRYLNSIKLRLEDNSEEVPSVIEFVLSKESKVDDALPVGNYKVNHIDGFISHFDGVFGVANISSLGERPFFATEGSIQISHVGLKGVKGTLNMRLSNGDGEAIKILGNFEAK